jgi:virginiamycin B lyase
MERNHGYCDRVVAVGCNSSIKAALVMLIFVSLSLAQPFQPNLKSYPLPSNGGVPFAIITGPDGALWFTLDNGLRAQPQVARMTTSGSLTLFSSPFGSSQNPATLGSQMAKRADSTVWFTIGFHDGTAALGGVNMSGVFWQVPLPAGVIADSIAVGSDGSIWFTEASRLYIGRLTPAGQIIEYPLPAGLKGSLNITVGSDGALWFTEWFDSSSLPYTGHIGRITTAGQITQYSIPTPNVEPAGLVTGPDGALWFLEGSKIARVTTSGVFTEIDATGLHPYYLSMASSPDGALWMWAQDTAGNNMFVRVTMDGSLAVSGPLPFLFANEITTGPDNNLWFTGVVNSQFAIGQIILPAGGPVTTRTVTGTPGTFSWYTSPVVVALSASDPGSPVVASYFNIDGGPYQKYVSPFTVSGDGTHSYSYYSVDAAGRTETPNSQSVKIDATKPISLVQPFPSAFGVLVFGVNVAASDAASGLSSISLYVSDNGAPFTLSATQSVFGNAIATIFQQFGTCGHRYGYYSLATDMAGNQENPKSSAEAITPPSVPSSGVAALPAKTSLLNFPIRWSGVSNCGAIRSYTVYVSDNGGPFTPWISQTTATQATFAGIAGHTYGFFSIAIDSAGAQEPMKTAAEAATQIVSGTLSADVNGDGKVDCTDVAIVKAALGKKTGQAGFDARADVNHDGIIDVRDLAIVTQALSAGTVCS